MPPISSFWKRKKDPSPRESRPSTSASSSRARASTPVTVEGDESRTVETGSTLTGTEEQPESERASPFAIGHPSDPKSIETRDPIRSVAFPIYFKHVVSGDAKGKLRCWKVTDGLEQEPPMDAQSPICNIAVSQDGKWIVSGAENGQVIVWNAMSYEKEKDFKGHNGSVDAVDITVQVPSTRIATGSKDQTVCVWSFESAGQLPPGPLQHKGRLAAVKFSPDGRFTATATLDHASVRIYDNHGRLVLDVPIIVNSPRNQSIAWANHSGQLFVLSGSGEINCLDISTKTVLFKWAIHKNNDPHCITLVFHGSFIAASASSSVSFWDIKTRRQVGSVIDYSHDIWNMAVSKRHDLVTAGSQKITLRNLCDIIQVPSPYSDRVSRERHKLQDKVESEDIMQALRGRNARSDEKITSLKKTIDELHTKIETTKRTADQEKDSLNESIRSLRSDVRMREDSSLRKSSHLDVRLQQLQAGLASARLTAKQQNDGLTETIRSLRANLDAQRAQSDHTISDLERNLQGVQRKIADSQKTAGNRTKLLHAYELKDKCEESFAKGDVSDAAMSLLEIMDALQNVESGSLLADWLSEFTDRCVSKLVSVGNDASDIGRQDEALDAYSTALSLSRSTSTMISVLKNWAVKMLAGNSVNEVLTATVKFKIPRFIIFKTICDICEGRDRIPEAITGFKQMQSELEEEKSTQSERVQWEIDFRRRCVNKLEMLGDNKMDSENYDKAIDHYSDALSLDPANVFSILVKCCNARAHILEKVLAAATKYIERYPSSYKGYKRKYAALKVRQRHREAFTEFQAMLSAMEKSSDLQIRERRRQYVDTTPIIQEAIQQAIRDIPRVFIDTTTGHLCHKTQLAAAFEKLPIYDQLRSSMTTEDQVDRPRIRSEVKMFYRYVMLSHARQPAEPTFQMVEKASVYDLPDSPTNNKLRNFCELVRSRRFRWAWSDMCCINQADKALQQESIVAMFRWFRGSSLTIVHLLGVFSDSQTSDSLWKSIWNTRAWTYPQYVASEVVQFYTEDWKPYHGLDVPNHKEYPAIVLEMEHAMDFSSKELATLQPGVDMVREKLYLASRRKTPCEEDIAYSLFGIFDAALPVVYGEGNRALPRLLQHVLIRSGDVTVLAWQGVSGSHDSYLPSNLTVYNQIVPPHVPQPIESVKMDEMVSALRSSLPDLSVAEVLYEQLYNLPRLSLGEGGGVKVPGMTFPVTNLVRLSDSDSKSNTRVYRASTRMLGDVQIQTAQDLSREGLILVHPWISPLLDHDFSHGVAQFDTATRALRLIVLLKQRFGALLLSPQEPAQYKRIATDALIMVKIHEEIPLGDLTSAIDTNVTIH